MYWLCGRAWLRGDRLREVTFTIYEGMTTRPPLDLPKPIQITPLEVATAMFEFPKRTIRVASVKNISFYI